MTKYLTVNQKGKFFVSNPGFSTTLRLISETVCQNEDTMDGIPSCSR